MHVRVLLASLVALLALASPVDARHRPRRSRRTPVPVAVPTPVPSPDALTRRVRAELRVFTDWLAASGARGYIGEAGWPGAPEWNTLAEAWFRDADAAGLWVTAWATGEWWGTSYKLSVYEDAAAGAGVDTPKAQSQVLEAHRGQGRGISVAGGEFAAPATDTVSSFSNSNPGAYDSAYHYDTQATFDFLSSRGISVVRIPFRWERIQRGLGGPLDPAELERLRGAVARAGRAGLGVVLDMHNYGAYYLAEGGSGRRYAIGSSALTEPSFADVWRRLSDAFAADPAVAGYGLMNEPVDMPGGARGWESASQAALTAIRGRGDGKLVLVAGYNWSGAQQWTTQHSAAWINDPYANHRYEAHHYWDRDNSGSYALGYADEVAGAASRGW